MVGRSTGHATWRGILRCRIGPTHISAAALERRVAYTPWHLGASGLGVKYLSVRSPKGFPGGRDRVACQDSLWNLATAPRPALS